MNHPPKRRGYCDTAVRTGTSGTGSVHQYSRYWFSMYSVRTYSWSASHSSSGVCFLHSGDCFLLIALDLIEFLVIDEKGHQYVLVLIDAFSRWIELYPTKGVTADETAKCIFQHLDRFGAPERILTDRGTAFHNELVSELIHMCRAEHELTIAYSKEENAIVERANQEVIRHLRALLFD